MQEDQVCGSHMQVSSGAIVDRVEPVEEEDVSNRLVYKLVRVEEDGTVVPATEDEVFKMETMLEGDASVGCDKGLSGAQGLDLERKKLLAQVEFLDSMLKKLQDEEHQWVVAEGLDSSSGCIHAGGTDGVSNVEIQWQAGSVLSDSKLGSKLESKALLLESPDNLGRECHTGREQLLQTSTGELESPSSTSKHSWMGSTSKNVGRTKTKRKDTSESTNTEFHNREPDALKGEACLDSLSIRELHEAFQRTFGRQTSVKDKQWLKRRISLGLREVASNNAVPTDLRIGAVDGVVSEARFDMHSPAEPPLSAIGVKEVIGSKVPQVAVEGSVAPKFLDHKKRSPRGLHPPAALHSINFDSIGGNVDASVNKNQLQTSGIREGKRQLKPTKRYIEELEGSDTKAGCGRSSGAKDLGHGGIESKSDVGVHSDELETESGKAHLGVSGLKFTTGYRNHRGRPKKTCNTVVKFKSTERAAQLVRKAISSRASRHSAKENVPLLRFKVRPVAGQVMHRQCSIDPQQHVSGLDQCLASAMCAGSRSMGSLTLAPELTSDEHVEIVQTPKGGLRRKHHRPWTIREVMKLVEGVARCGVGKWAEIKKLAFSSSVYRTSVDLKDKWRNLLRASDTHLQASKQGEQRRKHTSASIPGPILLRVRELVGFQVQSQTASIESGVSRSGRTVHRRHLVQQ
eukprot:c27672_g1_i2 orf=374-2428(+)